MTATVYATYIGSPPMVKAAQLTEETADDICRWTNGYRLGPDRWVPQEGCWRVSAQRWYPIAHSLAITEAFNESGVLMIGIRTREGERVAYGTNWIVQNGGGAFVILRPEDFADLYQALPAEGGGR